jgi:hypothetical protein
MSQELNLALYQYNRNSNLSSNGAGSVRTFLQNYILQMQRSADTSAERNEHSRSGSTFFSRTIENDVGVNRLKNLLYLL